MNLGSHVLAMCINTVDILGYDVYNPAKQSILVMRFRTIKHDVMLLPACGHFHSQYMASHRNITDLKMERCGAKPGEQLTRISTFVKWRRRTDLTVPLRKGILKSNCMLRFKSNALLCFSCHTVLNVPVFLFAPFKTSDPVII
jgi:hypothetical protein